MCKFLKSIFNAYYYGLVFLYNVKQVQNSIGDRTEKKTLGETRLSRGAISPLARRHSSSIPAAAKSDWRAHLVPEVLS